MPRLDREEYIEQAYVFNGLNNRLDQSDPVQIVLKHLRDEVLSTTKLPMAIDFLLAELMHVGTMGTATPVVCSAKNNRHRGDLLEAILENLPPQSEIDKKEIERPEMKMASCFEFERF